MVVFYEVYVLGNARSVDVKNVWIFCLIFQFLSPQSLIPDILPCLSQEAVVDLHPEEPVLSETEEEEEEEEKDRTDQELQIRRTVTQVGV